MALAPSSPIPLCPTYGESFVSGFCSHGRRVVRPLRCSDPASCPVCRNAYLGKVKSRIREGIELRPAAKYRFATFTLCPHTHIDGGRCRACRQPLEELMRPTVSTLMQAFRRFRRAYNSSRTFSGSLRYFRVVEVHKSGVPHLHLVVDATECPDFVEVSRPTHNESLSSYFNRQSQEAQALLWLLLSCGLGPIASIEDARSGANGIASYLAKYFSKMGADAFEVLRHPSGRRIRLYEASRDWCPGTPRPTFKMVGSFGRSQQYAQEKVCSCCEEDDKHVALWEKDLCLHSRISRWLTSNPSLSEARLESWGEISRAYARVMSSLTTLRRRYDALTSLYLPPAPFRIHDALRAIEGVEKELDEVKRRRLSFIRNIDWAAPVGLLTHLRRHAS